jgi:hypothetical protein
LTYLHYQSTEVPGLAPGAMATEEMNHTEVLDATHKALSILRLRSAIA